MKKFTKLFLSCMAVSAITAAVATSAMAAEVTGDVKGTYDEATGKLAISNLADLQIKADTQATILVVGPNADVTAIAEGDIEYINQDANSNVAAAWASVGLMNAPAEEKEDTKGTYTVMVGYEPADGSEPFAIASGSFTIGASQLLVGDVNGDTRINGPDAVAVLTVQAGDDTAIAAEYVPAAYYCNGDFRIGGPDAVEILTYQAGDENREFVGKTMAIPAAPAN